MANTIYKTKNRCRYCGDYIKITHHNADFNYYKCNNCKLIYAYDRKTKCFTKAFEERKVIKFESEE